MRQAERRCIAPEPDQTRDHGGVGAAGEQSREQGIFLRASLIELILLTGRVDGLLHRLDP
jgi:hypothetical protein